MDEDEADTNKKISRRDFLELVVWAAVVVGLEAAGATACVNFFLGKKSNAQPLPPEISPPIPQPTDESQFPLDLVFTGEARKFEGEAAKIVEGVEKDFGVKIISPLTWEDNGQVKENLPWSTRDIAFEI